MSYLYTNYGHILEPDLEKNNIRTMKPYDQGESILILIKQLEAGCSFTATGEHSKGNVHS